MKLKVRKQTAEMGLLNELMNNKRMFVNSSIKSNAFSKNFHFSKGNHDCCLYVLSWRYFIEGKTIVKNNLDSAIGDFNYRVIKNEHDPLREKCPNMEFLLVRLFLFFFLLKIFFSFSNLHTRKIKTKYTIYELNININV